MEKGFLFIVLGVVSFNYLFLSVIGLAISMVVTALTLACFLAVLVKSWYAILTMLVFVSGILVVCFYMMAVDYNPNLFKAPSVLKSFLWPYAALLLYLVSVFFNAEHAYSSDSSSYLFLSSELGFIIFLSLLLLFVLWAVTKIIMPRVQKLRPFF